MPNPMSLGVLSKLYVNVGVYNDPSWIEADLVSDCSVTSRWNEGESSVRRGRVQTFEQTNFYLEITGRIRKHIADLAFGAMFSAWLDALVIDTLVLDGSILINSSNGFRFPARVFDFSEDQNLGDVVYKGFNMKPSGAAMDGANQVLPMSATIVGGVPTYRVMGSDVVV